MRVYLDVCCLCRVFDDQTQERVRLEADAVAGILRGADGGRWDLVSSTAHEFELGNDPDSVRSSRTRTPLASAQYHVTVTDSEEARAVALGALGFSTADSIHLACAERAAADYFVTTDDRLLRRAKAYRTKLAVRVLDPVETLEAIG